ncbi:MAG TPA: peptidoglycan-binding domain-containing protein [Magnetospirillum sp.]|jgi:hypothetical protein|nr:peptidoglycan-binding domain-containing protein [Magnetospirillum sp.]
MAAFSLRVPLGTNYRADPDDIMDTKRALNQLGYYAIPAHRGIDDWTDDQMFDGIRRFQQANRLKVDGFMRPGGETERAINAHLNSRSWREQNANIWGGQDPSMQGPFTTTVSVADAAVAVHAAVVAFTPVVVASRGPQSEM